MSAPLPVELSATTASLLDRAAPCPACSAPLLLDEKHATTCAVCQSIVGSPGRFVDEKNRRKPLRPAFSTGPVRACCRCQQTVQRVLVDDVGGAFCAGCNLVFVGRGQAPRLLNKVDHARLRVETERPKKGMRPRDWAAVAVALVAIGVVAAREMGVI